MGYKLAGFDVVAANDIDPEMAAIYKTNHHPKSFYLASIIDLVEEFKMEGIPDELKNLDIFDGSPPCSSFSMCGSREKTWGKEKKFREGQSHQVLDDLFFSYLNMVELLQPRVFVAENVKGILIGKAKGYAKAIVQRAKEIGYSVQVFLVDASNCGVPQRRQRVFFVGTRESKPPLVWNPKSPTISFGEACSNLTLDQSHIEESQMKPSAPTLQWWKKTKAGESLSKAHPKGSFFNYAKISMHQPIPTITAGSAPLHGIEPRRLTSAEIIRCGSFPDDYNFMFDKRKKYGKACYVVGMSVPPFMIRSLAKAIEKQWLR